MERKRLYDQIRPLRALVIPAAVLCGLAVCLGIPGVFRIFDPGYRSYLMTDLVLGGITSASAVNTYFRLYAAVMVLGVVLSALTAVCLVGVLLGNIGQTMSALSETAMWLVRILNFAGCVAGVCFVYRALAYLFACLQIPDGSFLVFGLVIFEGLMVGVAVAAFLLLRKFLSSLCDSGTSIAYSFSVGKIDDQPIPSFAATGFLLLGFACLVMAVEQMLTLTIIYVNLQPRYKLLVTQEAAQWMTIASFVCCALADFLLCACLRRYKRISERLLHESRQKARP